MPTYDYMCDNCNYETEVVQTFAEKPKRKCPKCKKMKFRRVISAGVGVVFKGSGFYVTDSKPKKNPVKKTTGEKPTEKKEKTNESSALTKAKKDASKV